MKRILAVSDVHGYGYLLQELLTEAKYNPLYDQLYLLGDYIRKGPDSLNTLKYIMELTQAGAIAVRGNNEQKVLNGLCEVPQLLENENLITFIESLPLMAETERFVFVHAGIRPNVPLDEQSEFDLMNIRESFLDQPHHLRKTVVFGHTPTCRLGVRENEIYIGQRKIGIDTGAGHGKYLTLVDLTQEQDYRIYQRVIEL